MYTTLQQLKDADACIPGYTRMMAFFGPNVALKQVKIPLAMVALVGEAGDASWAAENALTIEPEAYKKLRQKYLAPVLKSIAYQAMIAWASTAAKIKKFPIIKVAFDALYDVQTAEDAEAWIATYSMYNYDQPLWTRVLRHNTINVPAEFIRYVIDNAGLEYGALYRKIAWTRQQQAKATEAPAHIKALARPADDMQQPASGSADEDEDDDLDDAPPVRFQKSRKPQKLNLGMIEPGYWFPYDKDKSVEHNVATLLCCGENPYDLLLKTVVEHNMTEVSRLKGKGIMLNAAGGQFHLTLTLSNSESIWRTLHMIAAPVTSINDLYGINVLGNRVESAMENKGHETGASILDQTTSVEYSNTPTRRILVTVADRDDDEDEDDDA